MKTKRVLVTAYDPQWPEDFEGIRLELQAVLEKIALAIEHVGSTAVPGMSAKPIIDIDVVIRDYSVFPEVVSRLEAVGYRYEGDLGIPGREAFCYEGKNHLQKHHLYVCPSDSRELHRHITFRNFLRTHPEEAAAYSAVKEKAARLNPNGIEDYIRFKSPCIEGIYQKCGLA